MSPLVWSRAARLVIALLSAAGVWLLMGLWFPIIIGDPFVNPPPDHPGLFILIGFFVVICVLIWVVGYLADRIRWYPPNIDEVPEPMRTEAKNLDAIWSGTIPALAGGAAGAAVATGWALSTPHLVFVIAVTVALALLSLLALAVDIGRAEAGRARRERIGRVRGQGRRVCAVVVSISHPSDWIAGSGAPKFTVTAEAETPEGLLTFEGEVRTEPADAPMVGGTVLVWYLGSDVEDTYMEPDPDSIRDPDAASKYRQPNGN